MSALSLHTRGYFAAQQKRKQRELEEQRVLSGLEKLKTIALSQFIKKGLTAAVVRLLTSKRVRLTGDEENQFVEVVS